jgi:hypothetical protein
VDIIGGGFGPYQNDFFSDQAQFLGDIGIKDNFPGSGPGEAGILSNDIQFRFIINPPVKKLAQLLGIDSADGFFLGNQSF